MDLRAFLASRPIPFEGAFLLRAAEATNLLLIRHGEAGYGSWAQKPPVPFDPPLTERGQRQAQLLAQRLASLGIHALYASPIKRALETAEIVSRATGLPFEVRESLKEISFTLPPGAMPLGRDLDREERSRLINELMKKAFRWDTFPEAEDRLAFRRRTNAEIAAIARAHPGQTVAVITHSGVINACVAQLLGCERDMIVSAFNTSVTLIRALGEERALVFLNDGTHLLGDSQ